MLNATFRVRPVPNTDLVNVAITGKSILKITLQTTLIYVVPVVALIVIGEWYDRPKPSSNTEDHLPETD